ncbi:hypothetical protein FA95DRAFT_1675707 [Auriscalpium vulgare]|uniref:Uncharacterized protein n=1 Tax=Auriscalpium vulgare TaxID=40419 RepID=A0ACB8S5E0_9AGAM|nr:hypothetical protein FA95DRAFT_1675707 [Auriscalpium vulgare]
MAAQQNRPLHVYPVPWIESTFNSRARTEELLRPELDDGTITQRDFDAARDFYSNIRSYHYYATLYGIAGSTAAFAYGATRRPPMSWGRMSFLGAFMSAGGVVYGMVRRANAHQSFVSALEDRPGFFRALEHVNARTGGPLPLGLPTESSPGRRVGNPEQEPSDKWTGSGAVNDSSSSDSHQARAPSRWDEIRIINTRNAGKRSAWEELRANQHRFPTSTAQVIPTASDSGDDLASEQAKFNAMLEEERKKAEGAQRETGWRS